MPDEYTTTMRDHLAGCYEAHGMTPAGAEQVANHQPPTSPTDQAMLGAYSDPNFGSSSNTGWNGHAPGSPTEATTHDQTAFGTPTVEHGHDSYADNVNSYVPIRGMDPGGYRPPQPPMPDQSLLVTDAEKMGSYYRSQNPWNSSAQY